MIYDHIQIPTQEQHAILTMWQRKPFQTNEEYMNSKYVLYSPETPQLVTDLTNWKQSFTSLHYSSYLSSRGFLNADSIFTLYNSCSQHGSNSCKKTHKMYKQLPGQYKQNRHFMSTYIKFCNTHRLYSSRTFYVFIPP